MNLATMARVALALIVLGTIGGAARGETNEVGALLVYPAIAALDAGQEPDGEEEPDEELENQALNFNQIETFVTITNVGSAPVLAHFYYVNGDDSPAGAGYCAECDFQLELTPNDTETLVVRQGPSGIAISSEDGAFSMSCPFPYGMIVVTQEDGTMMPWNTLTDNVLLGEQVVVDYASGSAFSIPAVPFQGGTADDDFRNYSFDDEEYAKLPRIVAADYLAPRIEEPSLTLLTLFTPGFERLFPPLVDCSVTGYDARENAFSASFQFGCWTAIDLCSISPEFCWPNLGLSALGGEEDTHGWFQLNCRVDQDPQRADGFDASGGVHGAIIQYRPTGSILPAGNGTPLGGTAAWGRLLYQSVTTGDAVTLHMQAHPFL